MYVQNFDDSRGLAIRITYRISLRSSSLWEPRHPLLKVVLGYFIEVWHKMPHSLLFSSFIQIGAGVGPIQDRPWLCLGNLKFDDNHSKLQLHLVQNSHIHNMFTERDLGSVW